MVDKLKLWPSLAALLGVSLVSTVATAQVTQTDAAQTPLPQPVGDAELTLVTDSWAYRTDTRINRDADGNDVWNDEVYFGDVYPDFEDGDAIKLEGLFKFRGEALDPVADARTEPGHFSPQCGFTGALLLRGGDCKVGFGWYNIDDPNSTTPPAANEIYEFIPQNVDELFNCLGPLDNGFCPLAWDNVDPRDLSREMWQPQVFDAGEIKENPNYHGGEVGFAVIGNPSIGCSESKFSLLGQNQKNADGQPWVTTLIYQSTVDPEGFYMAFEDLPMSAEDWHQTGVQGNMATNDGDFNDFVFYVTGLGCEGGGDSCDTGLLGACSLGRTDCAAEGQVGMCRPIIQPGAEICDNVDNDCNGAVDDGDGLCSEAGFVCDKGICVEPCGSAEFPCGAGYACNSERICVEEACVDVMCEAGEACREGVCKSACEGVTCPVGQECQLGRCVDPCAGIECPAGRVCDRGLCLSDCSCRGCDAGLTCAESGTEKGRCIDSACDGITCDAGMVCELGQCVDPCEGVVCPGGGMCVNGSCTDPVSGNTSSGSGSGGSNGINGVNTINNLAAAATTSPSNVSGTSGGEGGSSGGARPASETSGCGCRVGDRSSGSMALALMALAAGIVSARRRRAA